MVNCTQVRSYAFTLAFLSPLHELLLWCSAAEGALIEQRAEGHKKLIYIQYKLYIIYKYILFYIYYTYIIHIIYYIYYIYYKIYIIQNPGFFISNMNNNFPIQKEMFYIFMYIFRPFLFKTAHEFSIIYSCQRHFFMKLVCQGLEFLLSQSKSAFLLCFMFECIFFCRSRSRFIFSTLKEG